MTKLCCILFFGLHLLAYGESTVYPYYNRARLLDLSANAYVVTNHGATLSVYSEGWRADFTNGAYLISPFLFTNDVFTAGAFIKANDLSASNHEILSCGVWGSTEGTRCISFVLRIDDLSNGLEVFLAQNGNLSTYKAYRTTTSLDDNTEHFIACAYSSNNLQLFVDGTLAVPVKDHDDALSSVYNSTNMCISALRVSETMNNFFEGTIDNVFISSDFKSEAAVSNIYNNRKLLQNDTSLLLYVPMNPGY